MKTEKFFTLEDANAALPRLSILMERLQRAALSLHQELRSLAAESETDLAALSTEELLRQRPAARSLAEELESVVDEIQATGVVLKDIQLGLIDFPAEREGETIYLCWQFGEPEVAFWHPMEDGFAGRQPLPGSAGPRYLQ